MKKIIFIILFLALIIGGFNFAFAQEIPKVEINFFYSKACPFCAKEKEFLDNLEQKYPVITINRYDTANKENIELLKDLYQEYEVPKRNWGLVPITFTRENYFLGFNKEIAKDLEACIEKCIVKEDEKQETEEKIILPFFGQINPSDYSLPVLSVVLGTLDGFNVCSLGALVLILGLVLALRSRKKIIIFGGIFILTTAIVYGFLILLWHQLFSLLASYITIMKLLIGALGIGGGIYFLKQFIKYKKYGPTCEVKTDQQISSRFSQKFKESFQNKNILAVAGLVLLFAAIITIVEFPCSAIIPVMFAGVLSQAQLPVASYLLYIALFIIFYILDEIIIFLIAVFKMTAWLASGKFVTWITLIEAIALFALGFYYLVGF